jgi:hypothetical protein
MLYGGRLCKKIAVWKSSTSAKILEATYNAA